MPKYTKKPVTIEAVQLTEDNIDALVEFCGDKIKAHPLTGVVIETLEGNMLASPGDFIIKGIKGEFYPCKPDIFYATYDGPTKVLWDHTTGEYDEEYFNQNK
jgi:hypothetical protein